MNMPERLHSQVWSRFVRMPQGHLLDYADGEGKTPIPTAEECARAMPNALGWWTPIENGAFFTGLYAYSLIGKYKQSPDPETEKEIRILIAGLKQLQDVAKVDGFIARGVADDNVSHYPFSSEDQVVPWVLAMHAYLRSDLCTDPEEIRQRLKRTLQALRNLNWRIPTEREGLLMGSWESSGGWRACAKLLYCARTLAEITGEQEMLHHYENLRDSAPGDGVFIRKEIVSQGFAHDMVQNRGLVQSWIFVASHLGLLELCSMDPENARYFRAGIRLNGVTSLRMIGGMKGYDNRADGFDRNWRRLEPYWKPLDGSVQEAIDNALAMSGFWTREVVPHRHMEHSVLGFALFYTWIAVTCGEERIRAEAKRILRENGERIQWESLNLCYAFAAEAALMG